MQPARYWIGTDPSGSRARAASARCALRGTRAFSVRWPSSALSSTKWMPRARRCRVPMRCGGSPLPPLPLPSPLTLAAIPNRRAPARCRASTRSTGTTRLRGTKPKTCSLGKRPAICRHGKRPVPPLRCAIPTDVPPWEDLPAAPPPPPDFESPFRKRDEAAAAAATRRPSLPGAMARRPPRPIATPPPTWTTTCRRCARSRASPAWTRRARPPCSRTRTSSRCTISRCRARRPTSLWSTSRASPSRSSLRDYADYLTLDMAAAVFGSVAHALEVAHENQVLHLDIKPDNVLGQSPGAGESDGLRPGARSRMRAGSARQAAALSATCRSSRCAA